MEEQKEDKALKEFSWKALFIVTAISSFLFSGIIRLLDGNSSGFFLKTGIASLIISFFILITGKLHKRPVPRKTEETF